MLYENTQYAKCKEFGYIYIYTQVSHNIERYQKQTHSHRPPSQKVSKYLDFLVFVLPPNQQFLETTESSVPLRHGSTAHPGFVTWNPRWERSMDDDPCSRFIMEGDLGPFKRCYILHIHKYLYIYIFIFKDKYTGERTYI